MLFRALVGRVVKETDSSLGSEVTSARLLRSPPGWIATSGGSADQQRRSEALAFIDSSRFRGLGLLDVRNYYPSIDLGILAEQLLATSDGSAARTLTEFLSSFRDFDIVGLPVGFEASGPLGSFHLASVDHALRESGLRFTRHTDDFRLFMDDRSTWDTAKAIIEDGLHGLGLELHPRKTKNIGTEACATRQVSDCEIERVFRLLDSDQPQGVAALHTMLIGATEESTRNPRRARFAANQLASRSHCKVFNRVLSNSSEAISIAPRELGRLGAVAAIQGKLDPDLAMEKVLLLISKGDRDGEAYWLLRALGAGSQWPSPIGDTLERIASNRGQAHIVRSAAIEAASRCRGWRASRAIEGCRESGPVMLKRAHALTLRHAPPGRKKNRALRSVADEGPEVGIAINWVRSS